MADYREEFPDFGEMDVELPGGFADSSWKNEACPCFASEELSLFLWVDYADPAMREHPEMPRFVLKEGTLHPVHGLQHGGEAEAVVASDDWADVMAEIARRQPRPAA